MPEDVVVAVTVVFKVVVEVGVAVTVAFEAVVEVGEAVPGTHDATNQTAFHLAEAFAAATCRIWRGGTPSKLCGPSESQNHPVGHLPAAVVCGDDGVVRANVAVDVLPEFVHTFDRVKE